jgi:hypothetical protein
MPKIKVDATKGLNQFTGTGYVLTPATISATNAVAADATNTLTQAALTIVTSAAADNRVYLPSPTDCDLGQVIRLAVGANGFELSSKGDGTTATTINGIAVTDASGAATAELLVGANTLVTCVKVGDNAWLCGDLDVGTPDAV